jgi:hypothetical protein
MMMPPTTTICLVADAFAGPDSILSTVDSSTAWPGVGGVYNGVGSLGSRFVAGLYVGRISNMIHDSLHWMATG